MVDWLEFSGAAGAYTELSPHPAAQMLAQLLHGAGLYDFATGDLAHPGLEAMSHRIQVYAKCVELAPGVSLDRCLWTNPSALWNGSVAAGLADLKVVLPGHNLGYVLGFATEANARALFRRKGPVLRAQDAFYGDFQVGGPYLVLMRCEKSVTGKIVIRDGCVISVLNAQYPVPVGSALERDILLILMRVFERIDAFGAEGRITRPEGAKGLAGHIALAVTWPDGSRWEATIVCKATEATDCQSGPLCFKATSSAIADGSLLQWLVSALGF